MQIMKCPTKNFMNCQVCWERIIWERRKIFNARLQQRILSSPECKSRICVPPQPPAPYQGSFPRVEMVGQWNCPLTSV
jgi:hypothetical protein